MSNHSARRRRSGTPSHLICVWPRCTAAMHEGSPLCTPHLSAAHSQYEHIQRERRREAFEHAQAVELTMPLPPSQPVEAPAPKMGTVYFLRVGGFVKIGWTSDLEKRMRQYMPDSQLLATKPGTRKDENALHRKFAHLKTHGREWFPLAPQITEEADRIVKEHGAPPVVDFSARKATRIVGPRLNTGGPKPRTWVS